MIKQKRMCKVRERSYFQVLSFEYCYSKTYIMMNAAIINKMMVLYFLNIAQVHALPPHIITYN